ncbi:MAG: hypothetical protein ABEJ92_05280 [Halobacteriales archaeon]
MGWVRRHRTTLFDGAVALGLYVVLVAAMRVPVPGVGAPGYLLVLGFDAVQNPLAPGLGGGAFQVAFGGYLLALAGLAGAVAGRLRRRFGPGGVLRYGVAGAGLAGLVYAVGVLVAMVVSALPPDWSPVAVAAIVGLAGLWAGWRLAGRAGAAGGRS